VRRFNAPRWSCRDAHLWRQRRHPSSPERLQIVGNINRGRLFLELTAGMGVFMRSNARKLDRASHLIMRDNRRRHVAPKGATSHMFAHSTRRVIPVTATIWLWRTDVEGRFQACRDSYSIKSRQKIPRSARGSLVKPSRSGFSPMCDKQFADESLTWRGRHSWGLRW